MTEPVGPAKPETPRQHEEPGLFDSYGSFPVWMLRAIQLVTPGSLIVKRPPPEKKEPPK